MTKDNKRSKHICNTTNKYYKYCEKNDLPITAMPAGHCIWCGDDLSK